MARHIEELIDRQISRWNSMRALLERDAEHEAGGERPRSAFEPPSHPVICISRDIGAGAREVALGLCRRLNYDLYGMELINQIARDLKVQQQLIDSLDENARSDLRLILESYLRGREIETSEYLRALIRIVQTMALRGGVVLLGRGAAYILRERAGLSVMITAPLEKRIERVGNYLGVEPEKARAHTLAEDRKRSQYSYQYFKVDSHDPFNYDLMINTSRVEPPQAIEVILCALRERGYPPEKITLPTPGNVS